MIPKEITVDLKFNNKSMHSLRFLNIAYIRYTLASEGNSVIRGLTDSNGKYYIKVNNDDLVTFFTEYPDSMVEGLYFGKGLPIDGGEASDSDYFYTSDDTVQVSNGAALDSLNVDRLPMYAAYLTNITGKTFTLKYISINGVVVARPNKYIYDVDNLNLAKYTSSYMSYTTAKTLEYSVVVSSDTGDTTLTASVDLSKDKKLLIDGSIIK